MRQLVIHRRAQAVLNQLEGDDRAAVDRVLAGLAENGPYPDGAATSPMPVRIPSKVGVYSLRANDDFAVWFSEPNAYYLVVEDVPNRHRAWANPEIAL